MRKYGFEKLKVWQDAKGLAVLVNNETSEFPPNERFGLTSQLRPAVVSVSFNIAEGSLRNTKRDQAHFYTMAYSSLMEVLSQLLLAVDLGFIESSNIDKLRPEIEKVSNKLNALRKAALSFNTP